jgi:hypothetical protein
MVFFKLVDDEATHGSPARAGGSSESSIALAPSADAGRLPGL